MECQRHCDDGYAPGAQRSSSSDLVRPEPTSPTTNNLSRSKFCSSLSYIRRKTLLPSILSRLNHNNINNDNFTCKNQLSQSPTLLSTNENTSFTISIMSLPTAPLGRDGPQVTRLGFGLMGLSAFYGQPKPDSERLALLDRAHELGERFWDSSDMYDGRNCRPSNSLQVL